MITVVAESKMIPLTKEDLHIWLRADEICDSMVRHDRADADYMRHLALMHDDENKR